MVDAAPQAPRERTNLTLRIDKPVRDFVEEQGKRHGLSISEQAEAWFNAEHQNREALERTLASAFGGDANAGVLLALGEILKTGLAWSVLSAGFTPWHDDPYSFDQVARGINHILEALRPAGDPIPQRQHHEQRGEEVANALLVALAGVRTGSIYDASAYKITPLLGRAVCDRIRAHFATAGANQ